MVLTGFFVLLSLFLQLILLRIGEFVHGIIVDLVSQFLANPMADGVEEHDELFKMGNHNASGERKAHAHAHTHAHTRTHTHTHAHAHTHTHTRTHAQTHTHTQVE